MYSNDEKPKQEYTFTSNSEKQFRGVKASRTIQYTYMAEYQSSVAEWLSGWEIGGSQPTTGIGRIGVCIQGNNSNVFLCLKILAIYSPPNGITM